MDLLQGRADAAFLSRLRSRLTSAATHGSQTPAQERSARQEQRAIARHCSKMFARGRRWKIFWCRRKFLFSTRCSPRPSSGCRESWNCFPGKKSATSGCRVFSRPRTGGRRKARASPSRNVRKPSSKSRASRTAAYAPETLRDLAKISEINQNVFRQPSPRAMLSVAVNEVGNYLHATRCLAVVGAPGQPPQMASEFCASGRRGLLGRPHRPADRTDRARGARCAWRIAARSRRGARAQGNGTGNGSGRAAHRSGDANARRGC